MLHVRCARSATILCFVVFAALATAGGEGDGKIEGTWVGVGAVSRGKKVPEAEIAKAMLRFTFKDGKYSVQANGEQVESGTYKLDARKQPATIDMVLTTGADKGRKHLGIYTLERDTLTLAVAMGGIASSGNSKAAPLPRPKNFEGKGKFDEVTVFKRGK
jgi:uncharacterized protein (TIGR03067 family)